MKKYFFALVVIFLSWPLFAADLNSDYSLVSDICYRTADSNTFDEYCSKMCRLDVYYPKNSKDAPTVVWFHGGGLKAGEKSIDDSLKNQGIIIVSVNYRLYPKVSCPAYIDDAAAAVGWVFKNITKYNGTSDRIFVSGHSAGGYLTGIIGLDKRWLKKYDIDADRIAGLIPFSGHMITHFTIREQRGISGTQPIIDEYAPLYYVRSDAPPLVLITGDRNLEMLGRYEENAYMYRMMKVIGHKSTFLYELQGFDHGGMCKPAYLLLLKHIKSH